MKFGQTLEHDLVPEWRDKYVDYKLLKKLLSLVQDKAEGADARQHDKIESNSLFVPNEMLSPSRSNPKKDIDRLMGSPPVSPGKQYDPTLATYDVTPRAGARQGQEMDELMQGDDKFMKLRRRFRRLEETRMEDALAAPSAGFQEMLRHVKLHYSVGGNFEKLFFYHVDKQICEADAFYTEKEDEMRKQGEELRAQVRKFEAKKAANQEDLSQADQDSPEESGKKDLIMDVAEKIKLNLKHKITSLKVKRKALLEALREHYRALTMLQRYSVLNAMAVAKILKKRDKLVRGHSLQAYTEVLNEMPIYGGQETVLGLMQDMEALAVPLTQNRNMANARRLLQPSVRQESQNPATVLGVGVLLGLSLGLCLWAVLSGLGALSAEEGLQGCSMEGVLLGPGSCFQPSVRILVLLSLHMILFAVDVYQWDMHRINHIFIFDMQMKDATPSSNIALFGLAVLIAVLAVPGTLWLAFGLSLQTSMAILFFSVVLAVAYMTVKFKHGYLRFLLGRLLVLLSAPFHAVRFPDFFLGDQLTSHTYLLQQFVLLAYCGGESECATCHTAPKTVWAALAITAVPYWLRLMQCFRRLKDEWYQRRHMPFVDRWSHALNAGKYSMSLLVVVAKMLEYAYDTDATFGMFVVCAAIAATYACAWDFYMDWGLLRTKAQGNKDHFLLRSSLALPHHSVYYGAMIFNLGLRVLWVGTLVPQIHLDEKQVYPLVLAILEVLRRCHWNFFRVENEHLNNCGQFRATHLIPLPIRDEPEHHD